MHFWSHLHPHLFDVLRYALALVFGYVFIGILRQNALKQVGVVARLVTVPLVFQNIAVVAVTICIALGLHLLLPILDRSWLNLIPGNSHNGGGSNVVMLPMQIKFVGIFFAVMFAACVPELARREEYVYRLGTNGWRDGAWRSLRFGLAHCIMGVPIYAGLALAFTGLWYTLQYFRGGVALSTVHHAVYNWIVVSVVLFAAIQYTFI